MNITAVSHPLVSQALTQLREKNAASAVVRLAMERLTTLLAIEATRTLPVSPIAIDTPLETTTGEQINSQCAIVSILRAGLAMSEPILRLLPEASSYHIGLKRDEETLTPDCYYNNLPTDLNERTIFLCDPMLATGGSAGFAIDCLKAVGAQDIHFLSLIAAPEGIAVINDKHPDVQLWTTAIDRELDDNGYICPGLGDAGDRYFNT